MSFQNSENVIHTTEDVIHLSTAVEPIVDLLQACANKLPKLPVPSFATRAIPIPVHETLMLNSATTQTVGDVSNMMLRHHSAARTVIGLHVNWTNVGCIFAGVGLKASFDIYRHYKTSEKVSWAYITKCVLSIPVVGGIVSCADVLAHNGLSALATRVGEHSVGWMVASPVMAGFAGVFIGFQLGGAVGKTYSTWKGCDKEEVEKDTKTGQIVGAVLLGATAVILTAFCTPVGAVFISLAVSIAVAKGASSLWDKLWGDDEQEH